MSFGHPIASMVITLPAIYNIFIKAVIAVNSLDLLSTFLLEK